MKTPCMEVRSAKCLDRYARSTSMTNADDSLRRNIGICARSHIDNRASGATWLSAKTSTGGSRVTMREMRRAQSSAEALRQVRHFAFAQNLHPVRMDVIG